MEWRDDYTGKMIPAKLPGIVRGIKPDAVRSDTEKQARDQ
jgi:hypothetical protein